MSADQTLGTPLYYARMMDPALYRTMKGKKFTISTAGFSGVAVALQTSYTDTKAMLHVYNQETAGTDINIERIRLINITAPGAGSTSLQWKWSIKRNANRRTGTGTDLVTATPSIRQPNSNNTGKALVGAGTLVYGYDVTISAVDASTEELMGGSFLGAITAGAQYDIVFNANGSVQNTNGSDGGPGVVGVGHSGDLTIWAPGATTNLGTWFMMVDGFAV